MYVFDGSTPRSIRFTGTSTFLPFRVLGTSPTSMIASGTIFGESSFLIFWFISALSESSSSASCRSTTKSGMYERPPRNSMSTMRLSATRGMDSTTR